MKFVFSLKSRLFLKMFYCFSMFLNKHFINTDVYISKSEWFYNVKPSTYFFYMRTKISLNVHICISVPLMLEFPKAGFLVLHFPYYTLMTFLMILLVILLSMLMILLSTLCLIRDLVYSNN